MEPVRWDREEEFFPLLKDVLGVLLTVYGRNCNPVQYGGVKMIRDRVASAQKFADLDRVFRTAGFFLRNPDRIKLPSDKTKHFELLHQIVQFILFWFRSHPIDKRDMDGGGRSLRPLLPEETELFERLKVGLPMEVGEYLKHRDEHLREISTGSSKVRIP